MPTATLFRLRNPIHLTVFSAFLALYCPHSSAAPAAPNPPSSSAQSQTPALTTQFNRQPFPGGALFKTPPNPSGWHISAQRSTPTSPRDKKAIVLANTHVTTDKTNSFQTFEFSDGTKTESWTLNGLRVVSDPSSARAAVSDSGDAKAELDSLWDIESITGWTSMQELSWIKAEHFLSSYQGQESRYHIFVEEYIPQELPPSPAQPSPAASNKPKAATPQAAEQKYPQGMIPGVPLTPLIRAALIDANTFLPKRVQLGLSTLIYTYDATPAPIVLPPKVTSILPVNELPSAPGAKSKNTNVSSIPVP
jgi:hypothetical protein